MASGERSSFARVEDGERDLQHAAAVLHFYACQARRGWRHQAVDHDFCLGAAKRLLHLDLECLSLSDRRFLLRVADVMVCAEAHGYGLTARNLRRLAAPAAGPDDRPR